MGGSPTIRQPIFYPPMYPLAQQFGQLIAPQMLYQPKPQFPGFQQSIGNRGRGAGRVPASTPARPATQGGGPRSLGLSAPSGAGQAPSGAPGRPMQAPAAQSMLRGSPGMTARPAIPPMRYPTPYVQNGGMMSNANPASGGGDVLGALIARIRQGMMGGGQPR